MAVACMPALMLSRLHNALLVPRQEYALPSIYCPFIDKDIEAFVQCSPMMSKQTPGVYFLASSTEATVKSMKKII